MHFVGIFLILNDIHYEDAKHIAAWAFWFYPITLDCFIAVCMSHCPIGILSSYFCFFPWLCLLLHIRSGGSHVFGASVFANTSFQLHFSSVCYFYDFFIPKTAETTSMESHYKLRLPPFEGMGEKKTTFSHENQCWHQSVTHYVQVFICQPETFAYQTEKRLRIKSSLSYLGQGFLLIFFLREMV